MHIIVDKPVTAAVGGIRFRQLHIDWPLLGAALVLLALGLVMVGSASISIAEREQHEPLFYLWRQFAYAMVGLLLALAVLYLRIEVWQKSGPALLSVGFFLLTLVLLIGNQINGSARWISLGLVNIQPSEFTKVFVVIFMAGYLVRYNEQVRTTVSGFLKPMMLLSVVWILLLLEPDLGATVVIGMTALSMMFLAGVQLRQFAVLFVVAGIGFLIATYSSPYRLERLTCFLNPWMNPFDCGFQLTQSLIAFGRGELFGVGLGGSIQKLFYLPEAHTDFLFAVLAEELGMVVALAVISLYGLIVWRAFMIGRQALHADRRFHAYLAYGLGLLIGYQAFINIGVNMGMLPTKGLTLPLMSYGGSSVVATCIAIAILLRVAHENRPGQASAVRAEYSVRG